MTLPDWKALPVRTKRSRRRLHNLIATEFSLNSWSALPNPIKRSKKKLFNYYAEELHLEEFKELLKSEVRSTRIYYNYLKENADPSSAPTLTIIVTDGTEPLKDAEVTINETTETTDATGTAEFILDYDNYIAEIALTGYITQEVELKFRSNKKTFNIILEETPSPISNVFSFDVYSAETGGSSEAFGSFESTGETGNDRSEFQILTSSNEVFHDMTFWLDDNSTGDGTTRNAFYESSSSENPIAYIAFTDVNISTVTFTCVDGTQQPVNNVEVILGIDGSELYSDSNVEGNTVTFSKVVNNTYAVSAYDIGGTVFYEGSLIVDGDEEVTVTLEPIGKIGGK